MNSRNHKIFKIIVVTLSTALVILSITFYDVHKQHEEKLIKQDMTLLIIYTQDLIQGLNEEDQNQIKLTLSHLQAYPPEKEDNYSVIEAYRYQIKNYLRGDIGSDALLDRLERIYPILVVMKENPNLFSRKKTAEIEEIIQ